MLVPRDVFEVNPRTIQRSGFCVVLRDTFALLLPPLSLLCPPQTLSLNSQPPAAVRSRGFHTRLSRTSSGAFDIWGTSHAGRRRVFGLLCSCLSLLPSLEQSVATRTLNLNLNSYPQSVHLRCGLDCSLPIRNKGPSGRPPHLPQVLSCRAQHALASRP